MRGGRGCDPGLASLAAFSKGGAGGAAAGEPSREGVASAGPSVSSSGHRQRGPGGHQVKALASAPLELGPDSL